MAESKARSYGYQCPVRGCCQRNNRRFNSPMALASHIVAKHGDEELIKRLRCKKVGKTPGGSVKLRSSTVTRRAGETPAPTTLTAPHTIQVTRNGAKSFERVIEFDGDSLDEIIISIVAGESRIGDVDIKQARSITRISNTLHKE